MKRPILLILALALMVTPIYVHADPSSFSVMGSPYSKTYTLIDNTAITIKSAWLAAGGTWGLTGGGSTIPPKAVTLQAETNGMRVGFGGDTPTVDNAGIVITAGSTGRWASGDAAETGKICPSTAGLMPKVHMILEY